jgi:hypothetical protein
LDLFVLGEGLFFLCEAVDSLFVKVGGEYFTFNKPVHKVNYDSILIVFLDCTLKVLVLKELNQKKFHLQNDQNISIFSQ